MDRNAKFLIADFTAAGSRKQIYLLNPGDCFDRFGGSRAGLLVSKTASLVVRESSVGGIFDTEYEINDPRVWSSVGGIVDTEYEINDPRVWSRIFSAAHVAGYKG